MGLSFLICKMRVITPALCGVLDMKASMAEETRNSAWCLAHSRSLGRDSCCTPVLPFFLLGRPQSCSVKALPLFAAAE